MRQAFPELHSYTEASLVAMDTCGGMLLLSTCVATPDSPDGGRWTGAGLSSALFLLLSARMSHWPESGDGVVCRCCFGSVSLFTIVHTVHPYCAG